MTARIGMPVDPKWAPLLEELAAFHRLELPPHESQGDAIIDFAKRERATNNEHEGASSWKARC